MDANLNTGAPEAIVLERKKRIKKYLGIGSLGASAFFLFFPDMAIFDLLPDFIAYIILLCGISQLRDLNDYFGDAYDRFYKFAWFSAVRYLSFFFVLGVVTPQEQPDTMLLLGFVFAVFDFVLLLPAWNLLFDGFSYLSARCDGTTFDVKIRKPKKILLGNRKKGLVRGMTVERKPLNRIERIRTITVFFIGFKSVLTVLPEFSALSADTATDGFQLYNYIGVLRAFSMAAVLIFGVVWLVHMLSFVRAAKKDSVLISFYREKYRTEVLTKTHIFTHRHLQTALFLASIAMIFRVDFRLDNFHVIPDALVALFLVIAVVVLGRHVGSRKLFFAVSAVFSVCSIGVNLFEYYFLYTYSITSIQTDEAVYRMYLLFEGTKLAEQVLFVAVIFLFLRMLLHVIRSYTGFSVTPNETMNPSEKIKAIHAELEKKLKLVAVMTVITAISKVLMVVLLLYRRTGLELDWLPLLDGGISVLFAFFAIRTIRAIYSQVEYRFMLM